jgi:outer membrane protein TolC
MRFRDTLPGPETHFSRTTDRLLSVLTAQRSRFEAEDALAVSDRQVDVDLVALYKALGGGWEVESASASSGSM